MRVNTRVIFAMDSFPARQSCAVSNSYQSRKLVKIMFERVKTEGEGSLTVMVTNIRKITPPTAYLTANPSLQAKKIKQNGTLPLRPMSTNVCK